MAYVTITLAGGSSENSGPFDIIGTPDNITLFNEQSYNDLVAGQVYDIDMVTYTGITLTSSGTCNNSVGPKVLSGVFECVCPATYTVTNDGLGCFKVTTVTPTSVNTLTPDAGADNIAYGQFGVKIYNINDYNTIGNSISGNLLFSGFTTTFDGSSTTSVESFWSGRMNANNLWVSGNPNWPGEGGPGYPGYVSFCSTFTLNVTSTYWVGIAGDNDVTIKLNGVEIVNQADNSPQTNFKFWHIYPVELQAGPNIIELENWNRSFVGSFSAEIYANTATTLINATNINQLNVIFSTGDYLPGGSKYGEGFCSNYSCPSGYTLDTSNPEAPICKLIEYESCINLT